jgi:hypothetical protein
MTVRQALNSHPFVAASVAILILVFLALLAIHGSRDPGSDQLAFYTTDDGATLFTDDWMKVPPFDHDGKVAVKALVFTCNNGQTHFVQYLYKYSDQAKQQIEALHTRFPMTPGLIKRPGDSQWISESDPKAGRIVAPKCPDGSGTGPFRQVWP